MPKHGTIITSTSGQTSSSLYVYPTFTTEGVPIGSPGGMRDVYEIDVDLNAGETAEVEWNNQNERYEFNGIVASGTGAVTPDKANFTVNDPGSTGLERGQVVPLFDKDEQGDITYNCYFALRDGADVDSDVGAAWIVGRVE